MNRAEQPPLWCADLGVVPYAEALALQKRIAAARQAGEVPDVLLLLQHPPTYTRGRRSTADELPMGEEWYRAQGIEVLDTDRGGRVTYHGPGQLVGYPVVSLRAYGDDVARYVRGLEELIVAVLASYGIRAGTIEGLTGVWTEDRRKIGSIGIHVSRGVTTHGFAVNVNNDLQPFEWVVPCGIDHCRMSSVARERRDAVDLDELSRRACAEFGHIFGREPVSVTRAALDRAQAVPA